MGMKRFSTHPKYPSLEPRCEMTLCHTQETPEEGCDDTPSAPRYVNLFEPFLFKACEQLVAPIQATHISLPLQEIQSREWEKKEQTNNMLGLTQVQKGCYVTLCMSRLTQAWITSENSTTLLECRLIFPHCGWTLSHSDWSLCCPVSTGLSVVRRQLIPRAPLSNSLSGVPFLPPVTRYLESRTLCLVLHQNRQRDRLLGGPPT